MAEETMAGGRSDLQECWHWRVQVEVKMRQRDLLQHEAPGIVCVCGQHLSGQPTRRRRKVVSRLSADGVTANTTVNLPW